MAGEGQHIDILLVDIDVEMTGGLHGVGMEQDTFFPADRADLRNGQDGADLVVGVHVVTRQVSGRMASATCWAVTVPMGPTGSSSTSKAFLSSFFRVWRMA